MGACRTILQLVLADFRERTRRYSFLLTMLGMFFAGFLIFTGKYALQFDGYQGVLNSHWVGSFVAIYCSFIIAFVGFFLVKNTLSLDQKTGVGQVLASTSITRGMYIFGKFLSNFAILFVLLLFMVATAIVMQLSGNVPCGFDLAALLTPFIHIPLPVVVFVAAAAVLFESVKLLSGIWGSILYFMCV